MSDEPRNLYAGTTYAVLRRIPDGRCDLPPDIDTKQLLGFLVGWTQLRVQDVGLHALRFGPNLSLALVTHHTDPASTPPASLSGVPMFCKELNRLIAENRNAETGRTGESFWSSDKPIMIELPTEEDVWDVLVQIELLHITSGITRRRYLDPYLSLGPKDIGRGPSFACPPDLRCSVGPLPPKRSTVRLCAPPALAHLDRAEILEELESRCARVRETLLADEPRFMTPGELESLDRTTLRPLPDFPATSILGRARPPWKNHFVASHDEAVERDMRKRRAKFLRQHRRALERLRALLRGTTPDRDVNDIVFPAGTWGAWHYIHVAVQRGPPTPDLKAT